jgi:predicted nucleic-acid-binding protein
VIGIDTNVLVRYIVQDDPKQSKAAARFIESECSVDAPGWISQVVLCELVWVLESAYRCGKGTIVNVLQQVLSTAEFRVEVQESALKSLRRYMAGSADFSDYLIQEANQATGCEATVTFDKQAAEGAGMRLLI